MRVCSWETSAEHAHNLFTPLYLNLFIDGDSILSQEGTTQGDPLALAITPLIKSLENDEIKQVWFVDDATAGRSLTGLRKWWDLLVERGPDYGYHPNPLKTNLVVREESATNAKEVFNGTNISITEQGKRHLGAALSTRSFVKSYVKAKVSEWVNAVERLSSIAHTQPRHN